MFNLRNNLFRKLSVTYLWCIVRWQKNDSKLTATLW